MHPPASQAPSDSPHEAVDSRFMMRVFYAFAALALISLIISVGGKWLGASLARVGHTADTTVHEIVIGNNVLAVPANTIRFPAARNDGEVERLELYFRWPHMDGYSDAVRDDFNNHDGRRNIIFVSVEQQIMSRDMTGRLEPIYRHLIEPDGKIGPAGLTSYAFRPGSGYSNEVLMVGAGTAPEFVTRCLEGPEAAESLAPCQRDISFGTRLSVSYRFPAALLGEWRRLDSSILQRMNGFLHKAGNP